MKYQKYQSTPHCPWSRNASRDDSVNDDMLSFFNREIVVTEKLDGENTTIYSDGHVHARSIDSAYHPSRTRVSKIAARIAYQLPEGWRICGENMQAKHSIHYTHLEDWFYAFSIWNQKNECLSWDETVEWCALLDVPHAPVIYKGPYDPNTLMKLDSDALSEMSQDPVEGYVGRTAGRFSFEEFEKNVFKWVSSEFDQTFIQEDDGNWMNSEITENSLK